MGTTAGLGVAAEFDEVRHNRPKSAGRMNADDFRFGSNEKHIREALTAAFKRRGVDLAELDPSIRSIMVAAAFSTGVEEQVEAFTRLARVAEQFDLPDDLRREVAVKAYRSYAESLPSAESTTVRSDAGSEQRLRPSIRAPLRPEFRNVLRRQG